MAEAFTWYATQSYQVTVLVSLTGSNVSTDLFRLDMDDLVKQSWMSAKVFTLAFMYTFLNIPNILSGPNFVSPGIINYSSADLCWFVADRHNKYSTIALFLFCPQQLSVCNVILILFSTVCF